MERDGTPPVPTPAPRRKVLLPVLVLGIVLALALVWRGSRRAYDLGRARTHAQTHAPASAPAAP